MRQIVILCGGIGSRIYPLTKHTPKAMLTIKGKPFLYYQLKVLEQFNFKEVILCTGFLSNKISNFFKKKKFKFKIKIFEDGKQLLGTGGAMKKIINELDTNFFVTYGDTILKINYNSIWKKFLKCKKKNMMCIKFNSNKLHKNNVRIINNNPYYMKKNIADKKTKYIDYGCSILNKDVFKTVKLNKFDLGIVFKKLCIRKEMGYFITKRNFYEIGSINAFNNFKKKFYKIYR
jgi:NDP-sugar pyrophosphorylase family protein